MTFEPNDKNIKYFKSWLDMTTLRPFRCDDLFKFNNVNLDPLTETYNLAFYLMYLSRLADLNCHSCMYTVYR